MQYSPALSFTFETHTRPKPLTTSSTFDRQSPRWAPTLLILTMTFTGCQSGQSTPQAPPCPLALGMTTEHLASCGCFTISNPGNYSNSLTQSDSRQQGQRDIIDNYFCPRGSAGLAKVVVINGIANDVFE